MLIPIPRRDTDPVSGGPSRLHLALRVEAKKAGTTVGNFLRFTVGIVDAAICEALEGGGAYALNRTTASLICRNTDLDETLLLVIMCMDAHDGLFLGRSI
jgi:hypothetical protein